MKCVYVAGPYNGPDVMEVLENMRRGMDLATDVLKAGFAPFCPWNDYHYALRDGSITRDMYLRYSLAWLRKSDVVLLAPGWEKSQGTIEEVREANRLGIPVFETLYEVQMWARLVDEGRVSVTKFNWIEV